MLIWHFQVFAVFLLWWGIEQMNGQQMLDTWQCSVHWALGHKKCSLIGFAIT